MRLAALQAAKRANGITAEGSAALAHGDSDDDPGNDDPEDGD